MPEGRHATTFLIRASILLVAMLAMWWLVLVHPFLFLLRIAVEVTMSFLPISPLSTISGGIASDWDFKLILNHAGAGAINSITFSAPRSTLIAFTFSIPMYWAIALGIPVRGQERARLIRS